ncbi:MAG: baseplate J/gp47 family protein [Cohaesibacter sp.]|nr:baseplate J/gp47 family protein [Cohaesibacter sp.]
MSFAYAPTAIDLTGLPVPPVLEVLDSEAYIQQFLNKFVAVWNRFRLDDPTLPTYTAQNLEGESTAALGEALAFVRTLDRGRVNDAIKALLPHLAEAGDLDNLVLRRRLKRLVVRAADGNRAALMETDAQLVRRYLLSFDAPAAGSVGRYLFDAVSAWPGLGDARVVEQLDHGRAGDVDLVITGEAGALPTDEQLDVVREKVRAKNARKAGVSLAVHKAKQQKYEGNLLIVVPPNGPAPEQVRADAQERVRKAALVRALCGGELPRGYLSGAAYGDGSNVLRVIDRNPVAIQPDLYSVPYLENLTVNVDVAA